MILSYCVSTAGSVLILPYNFSRFGLVIWPYNLFCFGGEIVIFFYSCVGTALLSSSLCPFIIASLSDADVIEPRFSILNGMELLRLVPSSSISKSNSSSLISKDFVVL